MRIFKQLRGPVLLHRIQQIAIDTGEEDLASEIQVFGCNRVLHVKRVASIVLLVGLLGLATPSAGSAALHDLDLLTRPDMVLGASVSSVENPVMSADGRYVAYTMSYWAHDEETGGLFEMTDIVRRDVVDGITDWVTGFWSPEEWPDYDSARHPSISADGRYVAFAANEVDWWGWTYPAGIHVTDMETGETTEVADVGFDDDYPSISDDARYVVFRSKLGSESDHQIFIADRQSGDSQVVSVGQNGEQSYGEVSAPVISGDGTRVAFSAETIDFESDSGRTVVRNLAANTTEEMPCENQEGVVLGYPSGKGGVPSISSTGRFVGYGCVTPDFPSDRPRVMLRDTLMGTSSIVSRETGADGAITNGTSSSISDDGRWVTFGAFGPSTSQWTGGPALHIFARDTVGHETRLISRATGASGVLSDDHAHNGTVSRTGHYVTFTSYGSTLSSEDWDMINVYRRDIAGGSTPSSSGPTPPGSPRSPRPSPGGATPQVGVPPIPFPNRQVVRPIITSSVAWNKRRARHFGQLTVRYALPHGLTTSVACSGKLEVRASIGRARIKRSTAIDSKYGRCVAKLPILGPTRYRGKTMVVKVRFSGNSQVAAFDASHSFRTSRHRP